MLKEPHKLKLRNESSIKLALIILLDENLNLKLELNPEISLLLMTLSVQFKRLMPL